MTKEFEADKDLLKSYSLRHDKISDELKILNAKRKKAKQVYLLLTFLIYDRKYFNFRFTLTFVIE